MSSLAEIEIAVDQLPAEQKQELMLFLAVRLRAERAEMPPPRRFTKEQMQAWIKEDESGHPVFPDVPPSGADLLAYFRNGGSGIPTAYLDAVEKAEQRDQTPDNPWA